MGSKDLHEEPFDEMTIAKLEIFEDYAQAWIPTFVMQETPVICIVDFFAGTGYDKNNIQGSPIRILEKVKEQIEYIRKYSVRVIIHFNEYEPNKKAQRKFDSLKKACSDYLVVNPILKEAIEIEYHNEDFELLFPKLLPAIKEHPALVYLDQNGIKFLSEKYFLELEKTEQTDFLYFVSASYFWRFGDSEEFKLHLDIDMAAAKKDPYKLIHRNLIGQLKNKLPKATRLKLYPFSLKKGSNIHGIIFGASHPRAVDKFLTIAWDRNKLNGEANFDIDEDVKKSQLVMFGAQKLTKLQGFMENVKNKTLSSEIKDNAALYQFALDEGHIGAHAAECLRELKKAGKISYEGTSPLVTYENVYKSKKIIQYKVVKK